MDSINNVDQTSVARMTLPSTSTNYESDAESSIIYCSCTQPVTNSSSASESSVAPVSVKEMIKLYNSASKSRTKNALPRRHFQQAFPVQLSNGRLEANRLQSISSNNNYVPEYNANTERVLKICSRCNYPIRNENSRRSRCHSTSRLVFNNVDDSRCRTSRASRSQSVVSAREGNFQPSFCKTVKNIQESEVDIDQEATETVYHSRTTISKTGEGVRITIDIFFDQSNAIPHHELIGSRVETDIPDSSILSEFQIQTDDLMNSSTRMTTI